MSTQRCSTCNGEGKVCGHGNPASQCLVAGYTISCHQNSDIGSCADCDGRGWIVPKLKWEFTSWGISTETLTRYLAEGWEPIGVYALGDGHMVALRRSVPA